MPIKFFNTFEVSAPTCPHCAHEMCVDEMLRPMHQGKPDLFTVALNEGRAEVTCPSPKCGKAYWVKGGYRPHYTSAMTEDDL